jgi:ATP-binding cassette, subfamily B, bacterial
MTSPAPSSFQTLLRLLRYAKNHRGRIWWASFCSVTNKLFDVAPEILIGIAIDVVVSRETSFLAGLGVVDPGTQLTLLGVLTLFIWMGESLFEYLYLLAWRNLAQQIQHELRIETVAHVQQLDMAWFEDRSSGNLVSILNDDINQLERFLNGGANSLIQIATTLLAVGAVFFVISPLIATLAILPIPVIIAGAFWFQRRAQPLYADVRERVGALAARLQNNIAGIATIRSFTAESREVEALRVESQAYCDANRRAIAVASAFIPVIRMAILAGFLVTFVVGGNMALAGTLAAGSYGLLVFLTQRLLWPMTGLAETVDLFERAMASTRRVLDLLSTQPKIVDAADAVSIPALKGDLEFQGVHFSYSNGTPILSDVSLSVKSGTTVAFVGPTGSGKSTLLKLVLRFFEPVSGAVLMDGTPISRIRLNDLRSQIGLVSQDVYLFHGTVRENIAFGRPDATEADIVEAAKAAEAHEFIQALPQGYDTIVGERGQKLSGGQRQRVSIARAILKNPPILILDEATSAVDNETEAAIQRSMRRISVNRTVLVVAHRLSTIVHADQIIVLENGHISEQGQHTDLLTKGGTYATLWNVQTGQGT